MISDRSRKWCARLALALIVVAGCLWLWRFDYGGKVSTDVLDLVPSGEREPELALVRQMAGDRVARVVLLALEFPDPATPAEARERMSAAFVGKLRSSPAFAEVVPLGDASAFIPIGTYVFAHRFDLLLPSRLASWKTEYDAVGRGVPFSKWAAERAAGELSSFLARPEAVAFQDMLPSDPLLLAPEALEPWQSFAGMATGGGSGAVLIWARTAASPLREEGQRPVAEAVAAAEAEARRIGAADLHWTGLGRFAEASRRRIEGEMSGLNLLSLAAVLTIGLIGVRRPYKALNLAPVLLLSLLGAWVVTTAVFPRVHILVFVIGSLLGGVAVDYGFYLFLQPPRGQSERPMEKGRRLLKPLLTSSLTAVTGFMLLVCSDLPLIRELGVFVSAGLVFALLAAYLWYAQAGDTWWETRAMMRARLPGGGRAVRLRLFGVAACAVIVLGLPRLGWRDDIRDLDIASPELRRNAAKVQAMFGEGDDRTVYLSRGSGAGEAREALERFRAWHGSAFPGSRAVSVGLLLPREADWRAFRDRLGDLGGFEEDFRAALAAQGFDVAAFEPFFRAWREQLVMATRPSYAELAAGLRGALNGPVGLMMETGPKGTWFASLANHPEGAEPPAATDSVSASQLQSFNRLFVRYRESALWLSAIGLGLVGLSVVLVYGVRKGLRIFALPAGSCLFAFGLLGLAGQTLNLFHLLGAFLGVCLSHNYAIFAAENATRGEIAPPSIRLSGLTTAASFGVLALSHIAVIASLGMMVALIVLTALLVVELEPFFSFAPGKAGAGGGGAA